MADIDFGLVNYPKYATVLNGGVAKLGDGSITVGATALGVDGSANNAKACYTAGAYGGIVESLMVSTNDTVTVNLFVYGLDGAVVHPFGIVNIPLSSGNALSVPNVDVINGLVGLPINSAFKKYIPLRPNMILKVAVLAAMTAQKVLFAKATGLDYVG
jgi:hypothetical protein